MNMISGPHIAEDQRRASIAELQSEKKKTPAGWAKSVVQSVF